MKPLYMRYPHSLRPCRTYVVLTETRMVKNQEEANAKPIQLLNRISDR